MEDITRINRAHHSRRRKWKGEIKQASHHHPGDSFLSLRFYSVKISTHPTENNPFKRRARFRKKDVILEQ